jgi:hypothetical protein
MKCLEAAVHTPELAIGEVKLLNLPAKHGPMSIEIDQKLFIAFGKLYPHGLSTSITSTALLRRRFAAGTAEPGRTRLS